MEKKTRICSTCGKEYKYCPKCREDADKPLWHFAWCSENCKTIYEITAAFEDGRITATEAKTQLDKLDLSRLEHFGTSYKETIARITEETIIAEDVPKEVTIKETKSSKK